MRNKNHFGNKESVKRALNYLGLKESDVNHTRSNQKRALQKENHSSCIPKLKKGGSVTTITIGIIPKPKKEPRELAFKKGGIVNKSGKKPHTSSHALFKKLLTESLTKKGITVGNHGEKVKKMIRKGPSVSKKHTSSNLKGHFNFLRDV